MASILAPLVSPHGHRIGDVEVVAPDESGIVSLLIDVYDTLAVVTNCYVETAVSSQKTIAAA